MDISRTHLIEDLNSSMEGKDVIFGGWVVDLRLDAFLKCPCNVENIRQVKTF